MVGLLAIHHREGSYSDRWIAYCEEHAIPYRVVNCLATDIIQKLASAKYLLWHWSHGDPCEQLMARHVIMAAEQMGVEVFPNTATCWHFDDKVAQKYLLEALGAPLAPTYVFYDIVEVLRWIEEVPFPKVFKLRKGAGSGNVKLVRNPQEAKVLAKQAFGRGFWPVPGYGYDASRRYRNFRQQGGLLAIVKRMPKVLAKIREMNRGMGREKNYIYFQDFMPANRFDTRITIIGKRAFGFTRNVREGDFRASGSGHIVYDSERIHPQCIKTAFEVAHKLGSQSMAFDFALTESALPVILEVSYCFNAQAVYMCSGHWDDQLNWHEGHIWPQDAILLDLLKTGS